MIVVTGGTGFIDSHPYPAAANSDHGPVTHDTLGSSRVDVASRTQVTPKFALRRPGDIVQYRARSSHANQLPPIQTVERDLEAACASSCRWLQKGRPS